MLRMQRQSRHFSTRETFSMYSKKRSPRHRSIYCLSSLSLRMAGAIVITLATLGGAQAATSSTDTIKAFKLCTGADNASHVLEGTIDQNMRNDVTAIHFKQTPAHASFEWHNDPEPQYVMTLSGTLAFTTRTGEKFALHPGEVLVAEDNTGSGHRWNMVDDQPWRRGYVVLKPGAPDSFVPNDPAAAKVCKGS
jgi:quercetin dioxygenase-like cupin family protein